MILKLLHFAWLGGGCQYCVFKCVPNWLEELGLFKKQNKQFGACARGGKGALYPPPPLTMGE